MKEDEQDYRIWKNKNFVVESTITLSLWDEILINGFHEKLNKISGKLDGMAAVIFQHEFRHLLGKTYVDFAHKLLDAEELNIEIENGNYDDLEDCDSSIPHLLSDYKIGSSI